MEIQRVKSSGCQKWIVAGDMDRGSALMLESMLLNSQVSGEDVVLDLAGLITISSEGVRSLHHVCSRLRSEGGQLQLVGARGEVANCIRLLGLIGDIE